MKCQVFEPRSDGALVQCQRDADWACLITRWAEGGKRFYTCAEHELPREAYYAKYYVGRGAFRAKVVPIEAARARRASAKAQ